MWEFAVLGALAAGGGMVWAFGENRKILNGWRDAVEACGLRIDRISAPVSFYFRLDASDGPLQVRIRATRQKYLGGLQVAIRCDGPPGFAEVRIRKEAGGVQRKLREIELGDPAFDDAFFIQGPVRLVSALLDAETRRLLRDIHAACRGVEIGDGEIRAEMMPAQLGILIPLMMDLARRLDRPLEVRSRLAENARQDPEAGVRLQNVLLLAREQPEAPDSLEALRLACSDPSPWVRLGAALELGPAGRETLLQLADTRGDDALSAKAVSHLGQGLPFERAHELLVACLRWRRLNTARACLQAIAASGVAGAVEVLAEVLDRESGDLAAATALALGAAGDSAAEPALIRALGRDESDVQLAAAQALGRVGTAAAVQPLKEAAERRGADLRRATRQAVAEIQSRLPGASQGQLSFADAEAGRLSIAPDPGGQLSLLPREADRTLIPDSKKL